MTAPDALAIILAAAQTGRGRGGGGGATGGGEGGVWESSVAVRHMYIIYYIPDILYIDIIRTFTQHLGPALSVYLFQHGS